MDPNEYAQILSQILSEHSSFAVERLSAILENLPTETQSIKIGVHADQDGEGTFSVYVHLNGPDLYPLNQKISEWAELFSVRHTETGLQPAVPLMDSSHEQFIVNDVIVDSAARWLQSVWSSLAVAIPEIPVLVFGGEEYGTLTPLSLRP